MQKSNEVRFAPDGAQRARDEIRKAVPLAAALGQRILFENGWNGLFYQDD